MTGNQLAYLNLVRQRNTDKATLKETGRHNLVTEKLTRRANKELGRHNLVLEANQQAETAAGVKRAEIGAEANKYSADRSAETGRYAADTSAAASKYAADTNANTQKYVADRNAQTELTKAQWNERIQSEKNKIQKIMNDDNINAAAKRQQVEESSKQFIAQMERELDKYKFDKQTKQKYMELVIKLADSLAKNLNTNKLFSHLWGLIKR